MSENSILIETSFADAIAIIAASQELSEQTRRHWPTSMRQIAKALDKPIEVIPARYSAVRADLAQLHQVPAGLTAKTLQNHKSNTKRALLWLEREKGIPKHGAPLTAAWEELRAKVKDGVARSTAVVVDAVLLREQHPAGRGGRGRVRPVRQLSFAVQPDLPTMPSGACSLERGTRMSGRSRAGRRGGSWSHRSRLPWRLNGTSSLRSSGGTSMDIFKV